MLQHHATMKHCVFFSLIQSDCCDPDNRRNRAEEAQTETETETDIKYGGAEEAGGRRGLGCEKTKQDRDRRAGIQTYGGEMIRSEGRRRWCYLSGDEDFSEFTDMSGAC